jgi:RHS repeat-associated protein
VKSGLVIDQGALKSQTTYGYDVRGNTSSVAIDSDGNGSPDQSFTYKYNDDGIRISQTDVISGLTTVFHINPNNLTGFAQVIEEGVDAGTHDGRLQSTEITKSYTIGADVIGQSVVSGSAVHYLVYDGHGSTRAVINNAAVASVAVLQRYAYDAYGNMLAGAGLTVGPTSALTSLLYSGEKTDPTGLQYLRSRYYDSTTGRFTSFDSFAGKIQDPLSLHKYLYTQADAVMGIDPSGMDGDLGSLMGSIGVQAMIGASLGVSVNAVNNYALGQPLLYGSLQAAVLGGLLGPAAAAFPFFSVALAGLGIVGASGTFVSVFSNPNSTLGQQVAAVGLLGASVFGGVAAVKQVGMSGFWRESPGAALDEVLFLPEGQPQPTVRNIARKPQDVSVNPNPPAANSGASSIGKNSNQAVALQRYLTALKGLGAKDVRVNQQQVNAAGQRVGINKPDLQFTMNGRRWYIEWDTSSSGRGIPHAERTLANDPDAMLLTFTLD